MSKKDLEKRLKAVQQLSNKERSFADVKVELEEYLKLRADIPPAEHKLLDALNKSAASTVQMLHDETDPRYDSSDARAELVKTMGHLIAEFDPKNHFKIQKGSKTDARLKSVLATKAKSTAKSLKGIDALVKKFEADFKKDAFDSSADVLNQAQLLLADVPSDRADLKARIVAIAQESFRVLVSDAQGDRDMQAYVKEVRKQFSKMFDLKG